MKNTGSRCTRGKEKSLPMIHVHTLVPYSLYVRRGFREASNGGATTIRATTTTANTTTTTPRGGCTKTPWWGSGSRPHSPPLEMISVATRSREPQHVPCPSQTEPARLLDCPFAVRSPSLFLSVRASTKNSQVRGPGKVYDERVKRSKEKSTQCTLSYPFFDRIRWLTSVDYNEIITNILPLESQR